MKKYIIYFTICIFVLVILFCLIFRNNEDDKIKIGVCVYKGDDTFISSIVDVMSKLAKEKESQGIDLKFDISDANDNQLEQNDQVDKYLALDYDVICVNLVDRRNASLIIDKAQKTNTPIIFFNREPISEDLYRRGNIYYVGSNPKSSGIIQGELIVKAYKENPNYIDKNNDGIINYAMIEGEVSHQDTIYRTEYVAKTLNANGINADKIVSGIANFDRSQSMALVEKWIKDEYDIELIISNNDDMALGALDAYQKNDMSIPPIIGIDGTQEAIEDVSKGKLLGTVISDSDLYGQQLFELAYALATDSTIPKDLEIQDGKYIWIPWTGILNPLF